MEPEAFLEKHIDIRQNDEFHIYGVLKRIEAHGVWVESNSELSFVAFNNIKAIRLDQKYRAG